MSAPSLRVSPESVRQLRRVHVSPLQEHLQTGLHLPSSPYFNVLRNHHQQPRTNVRVLTQNPRQRSLPLPSR